MARRRYVLPTLGALFAGAAVAQAASLPGALSDRPTPKVQAAAASHPRPRDFSVRSPFSFQPVTGARVNDLPPGGPSLGDSLVGSFAFDGAGRPRRPGAHSPDGDATRRGGRPRGGARRRRPGHLRIPGRLAD